MYDFREISEFLRDASKYIITIVIVVIIFTFIVAFQTVAGNSMNPTLKEGEILLINKFSHNYERNQIVTLNVNGKSYVKRIIGLPGEKVEYMKDVLYINGVGYREEFLNKDVKTNNFLFVDICNEKDCPNGVIPDNMYLVLGDNRSESDDSRNPEFGLVKKSQIKGKAFFRIWPFNSIGGI